jgi:hypothetical protein
MMAVDAGALVAQLIDGGLSPTASKAIANAIANAASPQFSKGGDTADVTPTEKLRLIDADTRRYELTNLDYSPTQPFNERLQGLKGLYANSDTDHPYKDAQPRVTAPPLSAPAVRGSDYIAIDTGEEQNATVHTVRLKLQNQNGQHLRINSATSSLDAVLLRAISQTPKYLAAEVRETDTGSEVVLTIRDIKQITTVLEDGSTQQVSAWAVGSPTANGAFTSWAKNNLLNKTSGAEVQRAIGSPAAWVNFDGATAANKTGTYSQTGTVVTVTITDHGLTVGNAINVDITSGTAVDGAREVATVINANQFTYTATNIATPTSGNITLLMRSIRASSNVTSITRWAAGDFAINFATPLPDANYVVCGAGKFTDFSDQNVPVIGIRRTAGNPNEFVCRISAVAPNSPTTGQDCPIITVAVFR